jgi:hypothetical protein
MTSLWRLVPFLALAACGPGTAAKAVRPADPKAADALGKNGSCKGLADEPQLLTLDWDDTLRIDLEQAMKKGVVAVKYDCDGFKVLRDCDVSGSYEYAGFSPAKTVAKISDEDQLQANLPIGAAKISTEIKRGATIDIVYMAVGQQSTTVHDVPAAKLSGKCDGATHTVRFANVGAFAVTTGTKGEVNAAVAVLSRGGSAESSSTRSFERVNGELAACEKASDSATEPTSKCKALLELLLSPVGKSVAPTALELPADPKASDKDRALTADPLTERCPSGFASEKSGICAKKEASAATLCAASDFDDCKAQCDKGNPMSCYNAGANRTSKKLNSAPDGSKDAAPYFDKACQGGVPTGCGHLGLLAVLGLGVAKDHDKGDALLARGCTGGDPWSCRFQATQYEFGKNGYRRDQALTFQLEKRACALGDQHGCVRAAVALTEGTGVDKDLDGALKLLDKACDAGDEGICKRANGLRGNVASRAGSGDKVKFDAHAKFGPDPIDNPCAQGLRVGADGTCVKPAAGAKYVCDPSDFDECTKLCDAGDGKNCYNAAANRVGKWNKESKSGPEDAYAYLEKSCAAGYAPGCGEVANALEWGRGVKENKNRAVGFFDKACTGGDQPSCRFLATSYACSGSTCNGIKKNGAKGIAYYKKGCDLGDVGACKDGATALEAGSGGVKKNLKAAGALFDKACKQGETTVCDKAKKLLGKK